MADPTVADVYDQLRFANGKLDQINVSTTGQANAISHLNGDLNKGFKATVDALNRIAQIDTVAVEFLFHLTQQADTMICALEHISKNTCEILTQITTQTQIQTQIREDADALRDISESAHPEGALLRQRLAALREEVERCCPPEKPKPACTYEPCFRPERVEMPQLPEIPKSSEPPPKAPAKPK
jgi:hypothetical protein